MLKPLDHFGYLFIIPCTFSSSVISLSEMVQLLLSQGASLRMVFLALSPLSFVQGFYFLLLCLPFTLLALVHFNALEELLGVKSVRSGTIFIAHLFAVSQKVHAVFLLNLTEYTYRLFWWLAIFISDPGSAVCLLLYSQHAFSFQTCK